MNIYDNYLPLTKLLEEVTEVSNTLWVQSDLYQRHSDLKRLESRFSTYFLFTTIENPLLLLLDFYRTKLEYPSHTKYTALKNEILLRYRRQEYVAWLNKNNTYHMKLTFSDFIQYFISINEQEHHDDFIPFMEACQPCVMSYHYYMHRKSLIQDIESLARVKATSFHVEPFVDLYESSSPDHFKTYYSLLPFPLLNLLRSKLKYDLELYYALYPEYVADNWLYV